LRRVVRLSDLTTSLANEEQGVCITIRSGDCHLEFVPELSLVGSTCGRHRACEQGTFDVCRAARVGTARISATRFLRGIPFEVDIERGAGSNSIALGGTRVDIVRSQERDPEILVCDDVGTLKIAKLFDVCFRG